MYKLLVFPLVPLLLPHLARARDLITKVARRARGSEGREEEFSSMFVYVSESKEPFHVLGFHAGRVKADRGT